MRAAYPGYRLGWARSPPFPTHTDHPTTPLLRRRLHRFSAPGTTHKAFRLPTGPQHLRWAYFDPHLRRRTASVPRESRRGHRRSSWLGFQAVRRLPAIHHWRHDPSPFGSDLFSDTSPRRRRCGNPQSHHRLWLRPPASTNRIQTICTHPPRASATNQGPANAPPTGSASGCLPPSTCAIRAYDTDHIKANPFATTFSSGYTITGPPPPGPCRRTRR